MLVHTIAFDKNKWTTDEARAWLRSHKYKPIKNVHKTTNYLRYRIRDPELFSSFVTKSIPESGINIILGIPK